MNWSYSSTEHPQFMRYFEQDRQSRTKVFNPFAYSFEQIQSHLITEEESDFRAYSRLSKFEILHFLGWWEQKYKLNDSDREAVYAMNLLNDQMYSGKFWKNAGIQSRNNPKIQWFKERSSILMPEFRLYLQEPKNSESTFLHRRY